MVTPLEREMSASWEFSQCPHAFYPGLCRKCVRALIKSAEQAAYERGLAHRDALILGEGVILDGKRVDPAAMYKTQAELLKEAKAEGYERGIEDAAKVAEAESEQGDDCRCFQLIRALAASRKEPK